MVLGPARNRQARHILRAPLTSAVQEALGPLAQLANELELNGARPGRLWWSEIQWLTMVNYG